MQEGTFSWSQLHFMTSIASLFFSFLSFQFDSYPHYYTNLVLGKPSMFLNLKDTFQKLLYSISRAFGVVHSHLLHTPAFFVFCETICPYFIPNFPTALYLAHWQFSLKKKKIYSSILWLIFFSLRLYNLKIHVRQISQNWFGISLSDLRASLAHPL